MLLTDHYEIDKEDTDSFLSSLNTESFKARSIFHSILSDIHKILFAVMDRGLEMVNDLNPSDDDFAAALDDDLKEWTRTFGKERFKRMKDDLSRHYKNHSTDHNTPELWDDMRKEYVKAFKMAFNQKLSLCEEEKQEQWGEDMKKMMDESNKLLQLIYSSCRTEELCNFVLVENARPFISLLTPDNLNMFYDIIVRWNIIQCEMFPELKKEHEKWLNSPKDEHLEDDEDTGWSEARQSKLDEIIVFLKKGDWKHPATEDNVEQMLNSVFGRDVSLHDENDGNDCEKLWALVESGSGDRMQIVPANLAGFFYEENLLNGGPKKISDDLFGKGSNQSNNINKGKSNCCSVAFGEIIPFLRKYTNRIIRKV